MPNLDLGPVRVRLTAVGKDCAKNKYANAYIKSLKSNTAKLSLLILENKQLIVDEEVFEVDVSVLQKMKLTVARKVERALQKSHRDLPSPRRTPSPTVSP